MKRLAYLASMLTIAALALTTTSCTNEDNLAEEQTAPKGVIVTVGAGFADDATTRSEVVDENGKRRLKFTTGDKLYIYREVNNGLTRVYGTLIMKDGSLSQDGKSATFTGTLYARDTQQNPINDHDFGSDPLESTTATLVQEDNYNVGAVGISEGIEPQIQYSFMIAADVNTLMEKGLLVQGAYNSGTKSFSLTSDTPIFNCTISGLAASTYYRAYLKKDGSGSDGVLFQSDANGVATFAFATSHSGSGAYTIDITDNNTSATVGTIDLGTKDLTAKVYNVRRWWNSTAFSAPTNLANITDDYVAQNGEILTGTLANNVKISIADGAKVLLSGVSINANGAWTDTQHAGITCEGDATIILVAGTTNTVWGFRYNYPGIQAGPKGDTSAENKTLTISGTGTLNAYAIDAAAIGVGPNIYCGNIAIEGGTINADCSGAGNNGTGIGAGNNASCGTITISGGNVTATAGNNGAAGIGTSGVSSTCGAITISGGTVVATGSDEGPGIGAGYQSCRCGNITIAATVTSVTATRGSNTHTGDPNNHQDYTDPCIGAVVPVTGSNSCGFIYFGTVKMTYSNSTSYRLNWNPWPTSGSDYGGLHIVISNEERTWTLTPVVNP